MRVTPVLAVLTVSAALLAGCGGGGSTTNGSGGASPAAAPAGLTKAQFIAAADPICAAGKRKAPISKIYALIGQFPLPRQQIATLLRKTARVGTSVADKLSALAPPPADRAAIARWIGELRGLATMLSTAAGQVSGGDPITTLGKTQLAIGAATNAPLTFALDYGMSACSKLDS